MEYGLKGKTAIVTGSTNGIGAAIIEKFVEEGANVVISARKKAEDTDEKIDSYIKQGVKAIFVPCDVAIESDIDRLFEETLNQIGSIDIIVNNAGVWLTSYIKDMPVEDFRRTLETNLVGPFMICQRFVNYCIDNNKKGKIINMTSQAAFHGSTSGHAHYASSKAGLVGFTISLAREVARYGINVNAVAPGIVESKMVSAIVDNPERRAKYLERIPIGRIATTEDIAKVVVFLASSQADYMTGATLDATGGMLMR